MTRFGNKLIQTVEMRFRELKKIEATTPRPKKDEIRRDSLNNLLHAQLES